MLVVDSVSKRFGGVQAVAEVSFDVQPGSLTGLMGPNGAGKSTLFALISRFLRPDTGRVVFNGVDTAAESPDSLARLGLVRTFQMCAPFPELSTLENVLVAALQNCATRTAAERKAAAAIELSGLKGDLAGPASELGVPQRKRLELARALAVGPQLLLCDELMGGLTPAEQNELARILLTIRDGGVTLVVVEHAVSVLGSIADEMIALIGGRVEKIGSPADVLADPAVIDAYFGSSFEDRSG